ncbi:MAG: hypothetical protein AUH42_00755 [Gemmatimonadetes bacterium 13_1_40CM_70_11]|nr:MAG: hypothetical protein AUH42_00755 [Gemmatimonadetes bacterium 13_1_40CM_70_11]
MKARVAVVAGAAVLLFLPTIRYGWVQDDRGIIALNPAVRSIPAALRALDKPYWPPPSQAGLYRPLTILSYAVDWQLSGGRPGWLHGGNAVLHAAAALLVMLVLARWLPGAAAAVAGLVFAVHPVHVEGVASLVSRAELLVAVAMLAAVLAARRGWWAAALICAAVAMLSKEHGVITGVVILLDNWLQPADGRRWYPTPFYAGLALATAGYLLAWANVGRNAVADVAPPFLGTSAAGRLALALPAVLRAARLLVWPLDLSADYGPQVIPVQSGASLAAVGGVLVVGSALCLVFWCRRRAPLVSFAAGVAALAYLPTSNLLFSSGVVLAERNLYLPVLLVAAAAGLGASWATQRLGSGAGAGRVWVGAAVLVVALMARSAARLPVWRSNKDFLLTTLSEHPESYRAHEWAAAVLAGLGDTTSARREYARADSLFAGDPHLDAAHAYYLIGLGDTLAAAPLVNRARRRLPEEPFALRAQLLLYVRRGDRAAAAALADSVRRRFPWDVDWYERSLR